MSSSQVRDGWLERSPRNQVIDNITNTVFDIKRLLGRRFDNINVQSDVNLWPFKAVNTDRSSSSRSVQLQKAANARLGTSVRDAVISAPAYFNDSQRQATMEAGSIVGFNVLRRREVQATTGDNHLRGRDFDNFLVGSFVREFKENIPNDNYNGPCALNRVQIAYEQAKIALFSSDQTDIAHYLISLPSRLGTTNTVLQCANINKQSVHDIVFVGSSSRVSKIQKMVFDFFYGKTPYKFINVDEAVA
ncbi:70-kilodalton heat shock protein [Linnemannia hyalina]|uniref:70-kilodalton heat shock protein n=1 Tax=Linnemannia hyalina TaxID=64524 RepID=A0A9P7XZC0_9FUNG|nr:70-kilodalton heat shock protein [Linnemannia hyalina]